MLIEDVIGGAQIRNLCSIVCDYVSCCEELQRSEAYPNEVAFYDKSINNIVFVNPVFLQSVVDVLDLSDKILITHNSDASLVSYTNGEATFEYLSGYRWTITNLHPKKWISQNSLIDSVHRIPLGVTHDTIVNYLNIKKNKTNLIYKNFNPNSNPQERYKCDYFVSTPNSYNDKKSQEDYYADLRSSYFTISPNGYGVDCHRHWEALYFDCIPVVTRNSMTEFFSTIYPIYLIDDWSSYDQTKLTMNLYSSMMGGFNRDYLNIKHYFNTIIND